MTQIFCLNIFLLFVSKECNKFRCLSATPKLKKLARNLNFSKVHIQIGIVRYKRKTKPMYT